MSTYNEDCERVATTIRTITQHDVTVESGEGVYVHFGYREALVLEPVIELGLRWTLTAYAWDQSGGVAVERELGFVKEEYVAGVAKTFLDTQDENDRKLQEMIDSMPEGD